MAIGNSSPGPNNMGGVLRGGSGATPGKYMLSASTYGTPITVSDSDTLVHDGTISPGAPYIKIIVRFTETSKTCIKMVLSTQNLWLRC